MNSIGIGQRSFDRLPPCLPTFTIPLCRATSDMQHGGKGTEMQSAVEGLARLDKTVIILPFDATSARPFCWCLSGVKRQSTSADESSNMFGCTCPQDSSMPTTTLIEGPRDNYRPLGCVGASSLLQQSFPSASSQPQALARSISMGTSLGLLAF